MGLSATFAVRFALTQRRTLRKRWRHAQQRVAEPQRHYNFTDPESRMMRDNGLGICLQAYNAQLAVDGEAQVIVAAEVTQEATDRHQLLPMIEQVRMTTEESPACVTADAGYWHTADLIKLQLAGLNVSTSWFHPILRIDRRKSPRIRRQMPPRRLLRQTLTQTANRALYAKRQTTVEPVIAQIKETRGVPTIPLPRPLESPGRVAADLPYSQFTEAIPTELATGAAVNRYTTRPR